VAVERKGGSSPRHAPHLVVLISCPQKEEIMHVFRPAYLVTAALLSTACVSSAPAPQPASATGKTSPISQPATAVTLTITSPADERASLFINQTRTMTASVENGTP